jgi:hypothetical protein
MLQGMHLWHSFIARTAHTLCGKFPAGVGRQCSGGEQRVLPVSDSAYEQQVHYHMILHAADDDLLPTSIMLPPTSVKQYTIFEQQCCQFTANQIGKQSHPTPHVLGAARADSC